MANELSNAYALMNDPVWSGWIEIATIYQARVVLLEDPATPDHAQREQLARSAIGSPSSLVRMMMTLITTDPQVASKGATPDSVGETLVIQKIEAAWTTVAKMLYPASGA